MFEVGREYLGQAADVEPRVGVPTWPAPALIRAPRVASRSQFGGLVEPGSARVSCQVGPVVQSFLFFPILLY